MRFIAAGPDHCLVTWDHGAGLRETTLICESPQVWYGHSRQIEVGPLRYSDKAIFNMSYDAVFDRLALAMEHGTVQIHWTIDWQCLSRYVWDHGSTYNVWSVCLDPTRQTCLACLAGMGQDGLGQVSVVDTPAAVLGWTSKPAALWGNVTDAFFLTISMSLSWRPQLASS